MKTKTLIKIAALVAIAGDAYATVILKLPFDALSLCTGIAALLGVNSVHERMNGGES